jgi:hypothetical protein
MRYSLISLGPSLMRKVMKKFLPALGLLFTAVFCCAQASLDPAAVISGARLFGSCERFSLSVAMRIEEGGEAKSRAIDIAVDQSAGDSLLLASIVDPAFLSNMKYLRVQRKGGPLQQWLKTSRGVSRVVGAGTDEKVFGSDFTAEDFGNISPSSFALSFADSPPDAGGLARISAAPLATNGSYSKKIFTIDTKTKLIVAIDYFDRSGGLVRSYRLEDTGSFDGSAYPRRAVMRDLRSGGMTALTVTDVKKVPYFPARDFNPAGL